MKKLVLIIMMLINVFVYGKLKEIETDYFRIIYPQGIEDIMVEVALVADQVAKKQYEYFDFYPQEKFLIIYRNNNDIAQSKMDYKSIILHPNINKRFRYEKNFENWIEYYLSNNLAKLIVVNKINGAFSYTWAMKNTLHSLFTPAWLIEGIGIYAETEFTSGGRGRSAKFDMYLRSKILEEDFEGLNLTSTTNLHAEYYGYSFLKFYEDEFGKTNLKNALEYFSSHQIKGATEGFLYYANLSDFSQLEDRWKLYLKGKYREVEGAFDGERLTDSGGYKFYTKVYKKNIYYGQQGDFRDNISYYNFDEKNTEKLSGISPISGYEIFDDTIYYSQAIPDVIKNSTFAYSYKRDLDKTFGKKLDILNAINFVAVNGSGAAVFRRKDKQTLESIDGEVYIDESYNFIFQKLFAYEDSIYFSSAKLGQEGNYIYRFDTLTKDIEKITSGYSPFVKDNILYFSREINGVYNIFSYDLNSKKIMQLTNLSYGGFEPIIYEEDLYYLGFHIDGLDIYKIEKEKLLNIHIEEGNEKEVEDFYKIEKKEKNIVFHNETNFRNKLRIKDLIITPEGVLFTFNDELFRHSLILGNGTFEKKGIVDEKEGYYFKKEEDDLEKGLFLVYIYRRDAFGMPLVIINSEQSKEENFTELNLNLPYFMKSTGIPIFGGFTINNDDYIRASISIGGALGYAQNYRDNIPYNELFLESSVLSINYYFSSEVFSVEDEVGYFSLLTLPEFTSGILKYNMKNTKEAIKINNTLDYEINVDKGTITGRNIFKSITLGLDTSFFKWHNLEKNEKNNLLVLNPSIKGDFKLNYNIDLLLSSGYIKQLDFEKEEKKFEDLWYFGFAFRF